MVVNSEKFKAILLTKERQNVSEYTITLKGIEIKTKDSVTLLGVTIDYKLSFDKYVCQLLLKRLILAEFIQKIRGLHEPMHSKTTVQSFIHQSLIRHKLGYNGGFQTLNCCYSFRIQAMWPKLCMALVMRYDLLS